MRRNPVGRSRANHRPLSGMHLAYQRRRRGGAETAQRTALVHIHVQVADGHQSAGCTGPFLVLSFVYRENHQILYEMADSSPMAPVKANAKRPKDDKEFHRKAAALGAPFLSFGDLLFDTDRYPDPLAARPSPDTKFKALPEGVTQEMTKRWQGMIRESKEGTASSSV
ncbi:hypothetical protein IF1G_04367 [Cordyceps javanica]|uniref:Uncharacterized protein n=1 Tax=Cordyceps javanica TaxID=43265 RepID=A0A545V5Z2_9HYPO|nr:hypothetical protein IF1G_04367 [Cordyceps javanica]